jgi:hypothetical protein
LPGLPGTPGAGVGSPSGHAGWISANLPRQAMAATTFTPVRLDGEPALRVESRAGYGNLAHALQPQAAGRLSWRWRVEQGLPAADLRRKEADDTALKVCAAFALPLAQVPFVERQQLRLARSVSGDDSLPSAVLCYVWDARLPAGTVLRNAYTGRLRWWVLGGPPQGQWQAQSRDLRADFLHAFADEASAPVPLVAVLVGADSDNTAGHSIAHLQGLSLQR